MKRDYHRWFSPALQRDMELLVFGHHGARVLAFPTSRARFYEWEDNGMVAALREHLERGWLQLFCVDGVDNDSWYNYAAHAGWRAYRHNQYDEYVAAEVLPFSQRLNPDPFVIVTGASFGGYHALNFGLRHADRVDRILAMSAACDVRPFVLGHYDENVYFNNPIDFIPNENEPARLDALRHLDIILVVGREDRMLAGNEALSRVLWSKDIWHALRIWDGWYHDWPHWHKMVRLYIGGHDS